MAGNNDFDIVTDLAEGTNEDLTISANTGSVEPNQIGRNRTPEGARVSGERAQNAEVRSDTQKPVDKTVSLRDQISSALKGSEETPASAQQDGGQPRAPDGKFAPKPADVVVPPVQDQQQQQPVVQPIAVPPGLSATDAEHFAKLPAELQTSVARTMESLSEQAARYAGLDGIERAISPRVQAWAMNGMAPDQAITRLLALSDFATQEPETFLVQFAQQNGIDLETLLDGVEPVDPGVQAMQTRINELEAQVNGINTSAQQAQHNATVQQILQFAEEKDASGQAVRPYFEELGTSIMPFIADELQRDRNRPMTEIISKAYDRACWGHETVRGKLLQTQSAATEAARLQQQQADADRARKAGSSIPSGLPASDTAAARSTSSNLRDTIKGALAAHT
jgi:hypothetical protein